MSRLDLNRAPYFDDFDASKNYMRILYRPGRPVQARELNQMQSTLQNQIEQFASNIFKNGSIVSNAGSSVNAKAYARLMENTADANVLVDVEQFPEGTQIKGDVSGITATLVKSINAEAGDPPTVYIVYTGTAIDGTTSVFIPGETVSVYDENGLAVYKVTVRCPSCPGSSLTDTISPTGSGQIFTVDEGVFYYEGLFVQNARQDVIVTKYMIKDSSGNITNSVPCKLGLDFVQTIVTYEDDASLLDPSLGYPNSTAPGADRYKADLVLSKRSYDAEDGDNFILLCRIGDNMTIEYVKSDSEYSTIMDTIAKRTYETSGDYTIAPFKVSFYESLKKNSSDPLGWSMNGTADHLVALVTPSVGYVKGYRVETIANTPIQVRKSRDTKSISSFINRFDERTYVLLSPQGAKGIWPNAPTDASTFGANVVTMYDGALTAGAVSGSAIGTFQVSDMVLVSGDPTLGTAVYKYYIYNLNINVAGKKLADAQSFNNVGSQFVAKAVLDPSSQSFLLYNSNASALIFKIGRDNISSLRDVDNNQNGSISVVVRKKLTGSLNSTGSVTFSSTTNEFFEAFDNSLIVWTTDGSGNVHPVNLTAGLVSIDPTAMTLNLGNGYAGQSVTAIASILMTNQKEKMKTLTSSSFQTSVAPSFALGDVTMLGKADGWALTSVKVINPSDVAFVPVDVTSEYTLNQNSDDYGYYESSITRNKVGTVASNTNFRLLITFQYFDHSGTAGYFDIDSYAGALNDPTSGVTYETLPTYVSSNQTSYPVASSFDFRPLVLGSNAVTALLPAANTTAIFDIGYYLARTDLLQINKDGILYVKEGVSSESPVPPRTDDNAMALYQIWQKPYGYTLADASTKFIENKRYTMRDIGGLESRIVNLEYYTALSLLEQSAANMSIKDSNGLDRFKNGFIADNFSDYQAADLTNIEYKAGADRTSLELRPQFKSRSKKLVLNVDKSSNVKLLGNVAMLPFTEVIADQNPYATTHLSINPYFQYNQHGVMVLSPNTDTWTSETDLPKVVIDIDSGVAAFQQLANAAGVLGTDWGSWIDQNKTILQSSTASSSSTSGNQTTTTNTTTNLVQTTQTKTGVATTVDSKTTTYDVGDVVKDIQIIPYMRSTVIEFYCTKMKPGTIVFPFFDGQAVAAYCRSTGFQLTTANASTNSQLVAWGSPLITDSNGELRGEFLVPPNTFFTGEKTFSLTDDSTNSGNADLVSTSADASFFSGGLDVTKQDTTLNVISPTFNQSQVTQTNTTTQTETSRDTSVVTNPNPPAPSGACSSTIAHSKPYRLCWCAVNPSSYQCNDPVAQAIKTTREMVVTAVGIFFKAADPLGDNLFVQIRDMVNGYPGQNILAQKNFTSIDAGAFTSDDSSKEYKVVFDTPIYLENATQYAIVVGGYSPNTRIWMATLGQEVINMPGTIVQTPPTGQSSFRSLNGDTWNAEQTQAMKYNVYTAEYTASDMSLVFENVQQDSWPLDTNPFEFESGSNQMRVYARDHGFTENDRVSISMFDDQDILIQATDFPPQVGQTIHTITGHAVLTSVVTAPDSGANYYKVRIKQSFGLFLNGQQYTADPMNKTVRDNYLLTVIGSVKPATYQLNECFGYFRQDSYTNKYPSGALAGIALDALNTQQIVVAVDTQDSFIVELPNVANVSGRYGDVGVVAYDFNEKYDLFNISGSRTSYRATENWTVVGIGHGKVSSPFASANYIQQPAISFNIGEDRYLKQPYKIASANNEQRVLGTGTKSITIQADFSVSGAYVSPMINIDTFSLVTVGNRTEWLDAASVNVAPNASNRLIPETNGYQGSEPYKYVTRNILLQNPANDLYIYFDVYKDLNADFDVYVKRVSVYDNTNVDDIPWMKVDTLDKTKSSVDLTDRIEYTIQASQNISGWLIGNEPEPYTAFKVKLVGRSKNSAGPVLFRNLRAIAVT
jgi:hypothetical protein